MNRLMKFGRNLFFFFGLSVLCLALLVASEDSQASSKKENAEEAASNVEKLTDSTFWARADEFSSRGLLLASHGKGVAQIPRLKKVAEALSTHYNTINSQGGSDWIAVGYVNISEPSCIEIFKRLNLGQSAQISFIRNKTIYINENGLDADKIIAWIDGGAFRSSSNRRLASQPSLIMDLLQPYIEEMLKSWETRPGAVYVIMGYGGAIGMLLGLLCFVPFMPPPFQHRQKGLESQEKKKKTE